MLTTFPGANMISMSRKKSAWWVPYVIIEFENDVTITEP